MNINKPIEFFREISKIPRGSGNETGISEYLEKFAKDRGLFYIRDDNNNVFIRKKPSPGKEAVAPVLLQGHMDMVCEKIKDSAHDFLNDPIELVEKGNIISANGTTLGADDGIGVAMMLAFLDDNESEYPEIECLFTVDEERGMTGARTFDYSVIKSGRCINVDTEEEGVCIVSCAGGGDFKFHIDNDTVPSQMKRFEITVSGLAGGHSGGDIHLGRYNANNLMFRFLSYLYEIRPFNLCCMNGGSKHNVITKECSAVITFDDINELKSASKAFFDSIRCELVPEDSKFKVTAKRSDFEKDVYSFAATHKIIAIGQLAPSGVLEMSNSIKGLVNASANIGVVRTDDSGVSIEMLFRFNTSTLFDKYRMKYLDLAHFLRVECENTGYYPCWDGRYSSDLIELYKKTYKEQTGKDAVITAIHAGVECGYISDGIGHGADIISIGPNLFDIHTPDERMEIDSTCRTYALVDSILKSLN